MYGEMPGFNPEEIQPPQEQPKPEQHETGAEQREKMERTAERLAAFEHQTENAEAEMYAEAEKKVTEAILKHDLTIEECAGDADVRRAAEELAEIQQQAAALGVQTRGRISGLHSRFRSMIVGGMVTLSTLAGAMPTARAAEHEKGPAPVEQVEARPDLEKVKQAALEHVANDPDLLAAVGAENIEVIKKALQRFDARQVNGIAARLGNIDPARTAGETPVEINVVSVAEARRMEHVDTTLVLEGVSGAQVMDRIYIVPEKRLDTQGRLTEESVLGTLVHEQLHVAHSRGVSVENDMYESGTTTTIYEGMTEMLNTRVMKELGAEQRIQAYGGGTLASAYLMERILGTQEFTRLYFEGNMDAINETLTQKLGREGANAILNVRMGIVSRLLGEAQGMGTALEIAQRAKLAGIDIGQMASEASANGIRERIIVAEDADMVVLSKESLTGELDQDIIFDTGVRVSPHSFPIRVSIDTRHPRQGVTAEKAARRVNPMLARTAQHIENEYERARERTPSPEADTFFVGRTNAFRDAFHHVLQAPPEIESLQERYKNAATQEEKDKIEKEAVQVLMDAAREAARQIRIQRLKM
jgi:hypothetical protein